MSIGFCLFQESLVQEVLARQLNHSVSGPVFPGLHLPMYNSAALPQMPQLTGAAQVKERQVESQSEDSQSNGNYVQHLQSNSQFKMLFFITSQ